MKKDEDRAQDKIAEQDEKANQQIYEVKKNTQATLDTQKLREEDALSS